MEALVIIGILMSFAGSSRPASGSEHHLSHFFEITGILDNKEYFLHGIDVMYSAAVTCYLRQLLLGRGIKDNKQDRGDWRKEIIRIYSTSAEECIALQNKVGLYAADDSAVVSAKKEEIEAVLRECPDFDYMKNLLDEIELDFDNFIDMYGKEKIGDAVLYGKDLKDRYTVLWLNYQF